MQTVRIDKEANALVRFLKKARVEQNLPVQILGPVKPLIFKIQKSEIRHIFVKTKIYKKIYNLLDLVDLDSFESKIFITPIF